MSSKMEFGPVAQKEMLFKAFLIYSSASPYVQGTGTICAILLEGIMRNDSVELF